MSFTAIPRTLEEARNEILMWRERYYRQPVLKPVHVQEPVGLAGEVIGCFDAAMCEGLQEALAETTDERLKDLVERRLMYALYAAQDVTTVKGT